MNAYQLNALRELGISVGDLGCIMLDVDSPTPIANVLPQAWAYRSSNPALGHVDGIQTEHHVTLLYGLLPQVRRAHVDEVLDGWTGQDAAVKTDMLDVFDSPLPDEPYSCIVARQSWGAGDEILDAHQRLSLLPHINTHPSYKAHVTLAYVHRDRKGDALTELRRAFGGSPESTVIHFRPTGLNYGDVIGTKA